VCNPTEGGLFQDARSGTAADGVEHYPAGVSKALTIVGLSLAVLGALLLVFQELAGRAYTVGRLSGTDPKARATVIAGFALIAAGSALQIAGAASA